MASLRGRAGVAARARRRMGRAVEAVYSGSVRLFGPVFGADVRQLDLRSDGVHIWLVDSDGHVGKRRTFETFCRAMNRRLWRLVAPRVGAAVLTLLLLSSCSTSAARARAAQGYDMQLAWDGVSGQVYQVERADFSAPDDYRPMGLPADGAESMQAPIPEPGLFRVRTWTR